ncbi:MAG: hypothetical protein ACLP7O_11910 [Terracidiphilus sp.]
MALIESNKSLAQESQRVLLEVFTTVTSSPKMEGSTEDKELADGPRFPGDKFFTEWFRKRGTIYFFLFKKNLRVTNVQIAELIALLRSYRTDSGAELAFLSVEGYKEVLVHIAESFEDRATEGPRTFDFIERQYGRLIRNAAAIDVMFGSCIVYLPPGVQVDLRSICFQSGYIHSCGQNVYIRNIYKSKKSEMFANINSYLLTNHVGKRILFRPYSNEDFTYFDRGQKEDLKFGLDDVKLSVQKYFLGDERIADVIEEMRSQFKGKLVIPPPGNYHKDSDLLARERKDPDFETGSILFLIMDHSTRLVDDPHSGTEVRGNRHFIICYDQEFINENPFHLFDENKPAWFDHTTLPHTLAGAMINISRPFWPRKEGPVVVCDCFVGSGTTLLEASKYDEVECRGTDFEPISRLLIEDNIAFFSLPQFELNTYVKHIKMVAEYLEQPRQSPETNSEWEESIPGNALKSARALFPLWEQRRMEAPESSLELITALKSESLLTRLLFYTQLKGARRYEAAIKSNSRTIDHALQIEIVTLHEELKQLVGLRGRTESGVSHGRRIDFQGSYSGGLSIDIQALGQLGAVLPNQIAIGDCRSWRPNNEEFDLIITDPPYGFNTIEEREALAEVYSSFLRMAVRALKDGGQLVLALPDWSHTGRRLPAFILKDFITHQILVIAEDEGREVINSADQIPKTVPTAPYYWESEKALRRAILHFRFRKRAEYRRKEGNT